MKTFKQFLDEAKHRTDISLEKAEDLIRQHCKSALANLDNVPIRGSKKSTEEAYIIQGDAGSRESRNTSNHYTVILDHILVPEGYPSRQASMIIGNAKNDTVSSYGQVYAIIPYDNVKLGVCPNYDIWYTRVSLGGTRKTLEKWNETFHEADIPDYSFEDVVRGIEDTLEDPDDEYNDAFSGIFKKGEVEKELIDGYTHAGFALATPDQVYNKYNDTSRELWVGGTCIAVRWEEWEELKKKLAGGE